MSTGPILQPAWLLHSRPWRETSSQVEVFTAGHGRLGLIARGSRRNKSPLRGVLQPFQAILVDWSGRAELKTLRSAEIDGVPSPLLGNSLMAGFYVNELLMRLIEREDAHPQLFNYYCETVRQLRAGQPAWPLRRFEYRLLGELGYAVDTRFDASGEVLQPDQLYDYAADEGALPALGLKPDSYKARIQGATLLALNHKQKPPTNQLRELKMLLQWLMLPMLGDKPLVSSQIARQQAKK